MTENLTTALLISAYARGYFPMPDPDTEEILWFHPDPRAVIPLDGFHVSRSLAKTLRRDLFEVTVDRDFPGVMEGCADRPETWINEEMSKAFRKLHSDGFAHSVEVWKDEVLVGGVYGVALGGAFFAESMFHRATDASKIALYHLISRMRDRGMVLLEVQFMTPHLKSLGAVNISKTEYLKRLNDALQLEVSFD